MARFRLHSVDFFSQIFTEAFPGIAMVIGTFTLLSPQMEFNSSENLELLIATALVIFTFTQFYLFLFVNYMRAGNIPSAWISGFFIGVGLVVMVLITWRVLTLILP